MAHIEEVIIYMSQVSYLYFLYYDYYYLRQRITAKNMEINA